MTQQKSKVMWFKEKRYGFGWEPASWQGWVAVIIHLFSNALLLLYMASKEGYSGQQSFLVYTVPFLLVSSALLIYLCYKKGPKPKWKWGDEKVEKGQ
jgi:uncharacterized membrane protein YhaH (DUF805 family)